MSGMDERAVQFREKNWRRTSALEGLKNLLMLIDEVPSSQLRLLMQASCLDVISAVEELSTSDSFPILPSKS